MGRSSVRYRTDGDGCLLMFRRLLLDLCDIVPTQTAKLVRFVKVHHSGPVFADPFSVAEVVTPSDRGFIECADASCCVLAEMCNSLNQECKFSLFISLQGR